MPEKVDTIEVRDGRLIINVALTAGRPSMSGKNVVFFTTRGNQPINDDYVIGLNLYRKV